MANELKMAKVQSILTLHERGWSNRRIAKELGIHRDTVGRHVRLARKDASPGDSGNSKPAKAPPGSGRQSSGCRSECAAFRQIIEAKLDQGLTAKRIHQDLVAEHGFASKYHSVRRFVRTLGQTSPLPMRRMECSPGEEVQVDLGTGGPIVQADGRRRRTHVFRIVLSYSRKGYSEAIFRQTTDQLRGRSTLFGLLFPFLGLAAAFLGGQRAAKEFLQAFDELGRAARAAGARPLAEQANGLVVLVQQPRTPRADVVGLLQVSAEQLVGRQAAVPRSTRPRPVLRPRHHARTDRIAFHVANRRPQVRLIKRRRVKPPLPKVPAPPLPAVDVRGVLRAQPPHRPAERVDRHGNRHEVHVVGHQAVGPDPQAAGLALVGQQRQELAAVGVGEEHVLAAVAALRQVMRNAWNNNSCQSCHSLMIARSKPPVNLN